MNTEQLKIFLQENILIPFFCLVVIAFLFYIFCEFLIKLVVTFYLWSQKLLIQKSSSSNNRIIGKLLVANYRIYRKFVSLLIRVEPFYFEDYNNDSYFKPTLCSSTTKRNLPCILFCLGMSVIANLTLNNIEAINMVVNHVFTINTLDSIEAFLSKYKWILIAIMGMLIILYGVLKDKFTNDIIVKIHDEELENILVTHKDLYGDFIKLRNSLSDNIGRFLNCYKNDGIAFFLHETISSNFSSFKYDTKKRSFVLRPKDRYYQPFHRRFDTYGYENISEITSKMKQRLKHFNDKNPFYSTAALNKYVPGLRGFDISRSISQKDEKHLLCKEILESICKTYPDYTIDFMQNPDYDEESKIEKLNELLSIRNGRIIDVVSDSIEYIVELDRYINKFGKAFALKTRRKEFPAEKIIDRYK